MIATSLHQIIPVSFCPFESGKCGKEGKILQKFEYLEDKNCFLNAMKSIFHSF